MNKFVVADIHFEHPGITAEKDGVRHRPFSSVEEHDETIIERWNKKVGRYDKVYVLGDVCMTRRGLAKCERLNGKLHLIKGNHDLFDLCEYGRFYQISGYRVMDNPRFLMSHMPVHPMELDRFKFNVHGHLHDKVAVKGMAHNRWSPATDLAGKEVPDPRYMCVSMEHTNYEPLPLEAVLAEMRTRGI